MNKEQFKKMLEEKILILDGASGTQLQNKGMPKGVCPELWAVENENALIELQKEYIQSGSEAVYTFTLGASSLKLSEFGLKERTVEINRRLAEISRRASEGKALVAGNIGPTGLFAEPMGDVAFETMVEAYKEQVRGLLMGGVDFFVIETMIDIQEARAALLAVKECSDLPVCVSMSFGTDGRTLTGTDPVTALITLQSMGADAVGCNCSTGPLEMVDVVNKMKPYARVPIIAKPNAGLPRLLNGKTVFDMPAGEFAAFVEKIADAGANLIGGCCGTSPEYIKELAAALKGKKPVCKTPLPVCALTSSRKTVFIGPDKPVVVVGERINPTGKKKLQEELKEGKTMEIRRFALEQVEQGAEILDVNVGMPGIDESRTMCKVVNLLTPLVETPLCLDSSSPEVLEAALRIYPGRALINSISGESAKLEKLLPVAAKYGAMFVLLPLTEAGVPATAEERCGIIEKVYHKAKEYGYNKNDFVADGLVMTVSADQKASLETLKVIQWCREHFGCNTIVGLSNVSFGLPERSWINAAFFSMACGFGLSMVIANPSSDILMNLKRSCDVLTSRDKNSAAYIAFFSANREHTGSQSLNEGTKSVEESLYEAILKGNREGIGALIDRALSAGKEPQKLVDHVFIPAINHVGNLFDQKEYYLPQLIQSAEAMKAAFSKMQPLLANRREVTAKKAGVVLATVKGDIHDIGKNIVALMLKNYGYEVHDLGKDVSASKIIAAAKDTGARIVGLSALMTTTMVEMENVIARARKEGLNCKFIVGGAVVDQKYADAIGADGYASDAYEAVKLVSRLLGQ